MLSLGALSLTLPESFNALTRGYAALPQPMADEQAILAGGIRYSADVATAFQAATSDQGADGATVVPNGGALSIELASGAPAPLGLVPDDPQDRDSVYTLYPTP